MRHPVQTDRSSKGSGPYSQGTVWRDLIFVSGQGPLDPKTGQIVGETIEEQARVTLRNVKGIVEAGGGTMADVLRVTVFLSDMRLFDRFNAVYRTFFDPPYPARSCVEAGLAGILVEIDAIAGKDV